ncbi:beta-N-acetylhexosaminidase [Wenzhouxiangella limi]|uniref:beta-N-acetylhexosaminidase n=1 Tax=Wenzhouxiangella limi TaxID=2707351 RepID=A0A845UUC9_9GAMM|nr:beta-N-acetylhexosaminidase [Wenzhouxiangella limi]NDY95433.1 beta-N-acetylhexosaminidase [Wenzhouxiangella limi]
MNAKSVTGPLIVGIDGLALDAVTRERLQHPAVGGVILFSRNFVSVEQVRGLAAEIRALKSPRLLVTVDQEGGRVMRFRSPELTPLPPLGLLGRWFASRPDRACDLAYRHGRVMAAEMLALDVDLSFAPVLDLDRGSRVIGDRALAADPGAVIELARYYLAGMKDAGMAGCGKHFPGHGSVEADSHHCVVTDPRPRTALQADLQPFAELADRMTAVMMAHVCYPAIDERPAGFSARWIHEELRAGLGFEGLVISDDLDMLGAAPAGALGQRLGQAFAAGCELALVCNPASVAELLDGDLDLPPIAVERLGRLYGRAMMTMEEQLLVPEFRAWRDSLKALNGQDQ